MTQFRDRAADVLVLQGIVTPEQLSPLIEQYGGDTTGFRNALVQQGLVSHLEIAEAVGLLHNLPIVDLMKFPIDPEVVSLIPGVLAQKYLVLPITAGQNQLTLAMVDPGNVIAVDDVATVTGMVVNPVVAAIDGMNYAQNRYVRADTELSELSSEMEQTAASHMQTDFETDDDDDAPIVRFVNLLISQAIQDRASDIHVEPQEHELQVRYRIDGVLHQVQSASVNIRDAVISRLKIMSDIDIAERRRPQDGRISVSHRGRRVDLRVATLPTVWGEKVVLRILDNTANNLSINDLAMTDHNLSRYEKSYTRPNGMILLTGPTGSGKSTTLYATLSTVSKPTINVITVEDPVEYRMPGISQIQVNPRANMTFEAALRSILRADPDVVMVGEIRDRQTAQIAIEAALTGHLVLSTLHTNDAPSSITRLVDMGIEPFLVGSALDSVVAQRLARRLCPNCKQEFVADAKTLHAMAFNRDSDESVTLYRPVGCVQCSGTGYRGRIAIHEIMIVNEEIEHLTVNNASGNELRKAAIEQGMVGLREDGWLKARDGLTSLEEVLRVVA